MTKPLLQIVIASTRPGRVGQAVAEWFKERAEAQGGFDVELIDLAEVDLPFMNEPNHPSLGRYVHAHTKAWSATIDRGDAYVFVTPEYNHSFNAVLKNALDYLHAEWQRKAVGFVSYGGVAAGTRAVQALKPVVSMLKMTPVLESVNIPFIGRHLDDERRFRTDDTLNAAAGDMLNELATVTEALLPLRARGNSPSPTPRPAAAQPQTARA